MFDVISMGRVSMDLFAEQIGRPFEQVESFATSVGGSPTNIAIGTSRLGLRAAVMTAVGADKVGEFVRANLRKENVSTRYVLQKTTGNCRTGLAAVSVAPPDSFPLTFYRENPADIYIDISDVQTIDFTKTRVLLLSGSALARGDGRDATFAAAERARAANVTVFLDLDLRPDQWHDPRAYGVNVRALLPLIDVIIGTEEESYAALFENTSPASSSVIEPLTDRQKNTLMTGIASLKPAKSVWLLKQGASGVRVYADTTDDAVHVAGFPVEIVNTVGAGDAFASGLIYGFVQRWSWVDAARFANACGALVVNRHGCSSAMPTLNEVTAFIQTHKHMRS